MRQIGMVNRNSITHDILSLHLEPYHFSIIYAERLFSINGSDKFGMIKVPVPPPEEQVKICNRIQEIHTAFSEATSKVEQEIDLL